MHIVDTAFQWHKIGEREMDFQASDMNEAAATKYYGFLAENGSWIIMQHNTTAGTIRYCKGTTGYSNNWNQITGGTLTFGFYGSQL